MQQTQYSWKPVVMMVLLSLFLHVLHWILYDAIAVTYAFCFLTPLLLCLCYHLFQTDCQATFGFSRKKVFFGTVFIPLLAAIAVSGIVFINNPHLGLYSHGGQLTGGAAEKIGLYAGRTILSGIYVLLFSVADIPILHWQDRNRYEKESAILTEKDRTKKQVFQQQATESFDKEETR
ncbi:MAG: hypothetical protein IJ512_00975 [Ruminococcus sp.]|nr:hypothetical protein [Ruminococcus sp.]